jgi:hypothetical protein
MLSCKHLDMIVLHDADRLPPFSTNMDLQGLFEAKLASH